MCVCVCVCWGNDGSEEVEAVWPAKLRVYCNRAGTVWQWLLVKVVAKELMTRLTDALHVGSDRKSRVQEDSRIGVEIYYAHGSHWWWLLWALKRWERDSALTWSDHEDFGKHGGIWTGYWGRYRVCLKPRGKGQEFKASDILIWVLYTHFLFLYFCMYSVAQLCLTLRPYGLQHTRLPCPSPTPGACSNSCPSSRWCHPTI